MEKYFKPRPLRDGTAELLLQAHGLGAQLKLIRAVLLGLAPLVFHRIRQPPPLPAPQENSCRVPVKFYTLTQSSETNGAILFKNPLTNN